MALQNKSRDEIHAWLKDFQNATDSLTTSSLHEFFTPTAHLRFANNEEVVGIDSIVSFFEATFPLLSKMRHDIVSFDVINNKIYLECTISYVVAQDAENKEVTIPAMGVVFLLPEEEAQGKGSAILDRFDVYLDFAPVLARVEEVKKTLDKP